MAVASLTIAALDPASAIEVEVSPATGPHASDDQFTLVIRQGAAEEHFEKVSLAGRSRYNVTKIVNQNSKLVRITEEQSVGTPAERAPIPGTFLLVPIPPTAPPPGSS
jgi:hypothetical protein